MRASVEIVDRLRSIAERKSRFSYDIRGRAFVDMGIVAAYKATQGERFTDLPEVIQHAMEHEGIVGAWKDPENGKIYYNSCRLFTDSESANMFARAQSHRSIFNLNRMQEIMVNAA
ncbi:MAG: hypothetical protein M3R08_12125 [Bacteroidota bacterium]|nr:hypothetical protein [Bacteroidota bacterium]